MAAIIAITLGVATVMLDSVSSISGAYGLTIRAVEWGLTGIFTIE